MATRQLTVSPGFNLAVAPLAQDTRSQDLRELLYDAAPPNSEFQGITQHHWKPTKDHPSCMNPSCQRTFTLTERPHHCRRCGGVLCTACSLHRRRLSQLAHPDPSGKFHRVCLRCFEDPQTLGCTRSVMAEFQLAKLALLQRQGARGMTISSPHKRSRVEVLSACRRLTEGFQTSLGHSVLRRAVGDIKAVVKKPEWQLPVNVVYKALVPHCRLCRKQFTIWNKRRNCTVCGAATCRTCSTRELIVYVPDDENTARTDTDVHWSVIKIVGCPGQEPDRCVYLRVCGACQATLTDLQVGDHYSQLEEVDEQEDACRAIIQAHERFSTILYKIENQLPQYQALIEVLEGSPLSAPALPSGRSNVQVLAKAQGDLSDQFTQLVLTIQAVSRLKPATRVQGVIVRNMMKSKRDYYQENVFIVRGLQKKLEAWTPLEALQLIQGIVDCNAINSCYLSVKQLALEVLHISDKWEVQESLLITLAQLEEEVLKELQKSVVQSGENWDQHKQCVDQLLQIQLKHHRLIRTPSRPPDTLTQRQGRARIRHRCHSLLQQVSLQLSAKCYDRSFPQAKAALYGALKEVTAADGTLNPDS